MASFKAHIQGSILSAALVTTGGFYFLALPPLQLVSVFVMGVLGGMLPDLDSDSGKPLELLFGSAAILIPGLLLPHFLAYAAMRAEYLVPYFLFSYLFINYGLRFLFTRLTVHRGIIHSIPFSLVCAQGFYILFSGSGQAFALTVAVGVWLGFVLHLIMDELNAIYFKWGLIPMVKNSSGTAMKLYSRDVVPTLSVYGLLIFMNVGWLEGLYRPLDNL